MTVDTMAPHDKAALAASATAALAATDDTRRSGEPPFVSVPIATPPASATATAAKAKTERRLRMPFCSAWFDRGMASGTVASAAMRITVLGVLLVATVISYAISIQRIQAMASSAAASVAAASASASASASAKAKVHPSASATASALPTPTNGTSTSGFSDSDGVELAATAPIFVHILFIAALLILVIALIRSVRSLGRARLYGTTPRSSNGSVQWPTEAGESSAAVAVASSPTRFVRALFGGPPAKGPAPTLPSYNQALQQSARQAARREAAEANVPGYTAGRRGREQIGTGDPEDLEIERVKRLGGPPPTYRSEGMRGPVLDRGPAGERRRWRSSWLSTVVSDDGTATSPSRTSRRISAVTGMLADLVRRISFVPSAVSDNSPQPSGERVETAQREGKPSMLRLSFPVESGAQGLGIGGHLMSERTPLPSPSSPAPISPLSARTIRFAERRSHLRQRSSTSGPAVFGITSPPRSAVSSHDEDTTIVIEVEEPRS